MDLVQGIGTPQLVSSQVASVDMNETLNSLIRDWLAPNPGESLTMDSQPISSRLSHGPPRNQPEPILSQRSFTLAVCSSLASRDQRDLETWDRV